MAKEDKELLLKDLCARLPYGVKVRDELGRINKLVIGNADLVRLYYKDFSIYSEEKLSLPYLFPLSSMTEEQKIKCFEGTDIELDEDYEIWSKISSVKYIVGLLTGGLMEDPILKFTEPYDIIEANSVKEAKDIYNKKHKCYYFYGSVMCAIVDDNITDINPNCSYNECLRVFKNKE